MSTGAAELEAPGAGEVEGGVGVDEPPCWKRACKFRGGFVASAGTDPKAFGAPLLNAGGAAGEDERVAFLSLAVPNATGRGKTMVSRVSQRGGNLDAPSDAAAPRISSTLEGGTLTPSTCTLDFLACVGLEGCEPAAAAIAVAAGTVGLLAAFDPFTYPVASWPETAAGEGLLFFAAAA